MNSYILIAVAAYLAFAVNSVIDKFLLNRAIPQPSTYAFYIGVLSQVTILLAPFGLHMPGLRVGILAVASGMCFIYALIAFFSSLKHEETAVVLPTIGALVPLATLGLGFIIVGERLNEREIMGLFLLVAGTALLSGHIVRPKLGYAWLRWAILAAILFSMSFTLAKAVYLETNFITGLIWTRFGLGIAGLSILLSGSARRQIFHTTRSVGRSSGTLFMSGQLLAAGGGVLQNLAVASGSVTIVNALQGTQFAFLFLLSWSLSRWFPNILSEDFSRPAVIRKMSALALITAGLIFIT